MGVNPSDVRAAALEAGREMLNRRRARFTQMSPLCVEITLATRTLLRFVEEASGVGYRVKLVFLFTPFADVNELRVKQRVMAGGHNIETDTIRRRHARPARIEASGGAPLKLESRESFESTSVRIGNRSTSSSQSY